MSELVRYSPGEAIRWLEYGAGSLRDSAKKQGLSLVRREGERSIGKDLTDVLGTLVKAGKGTVAELLHQQVDATEYVFDEDHLELSKGSYRKKVRYDEVKKIKKHGDKFTVVLGQGSLNVTPYAHIVAGTVKVPIGWQRNGIEVPYELLIEELSARCRVDVETE